MKTQFVAILLLALVAFSEATATRQQVLQGKQLFQQMKDSGDIGKNLYETIQLELSAADAGEDQTIISKVVELLKEVQAQIQSDKDEIQGQVDENNETCNVTVDQLQVDIDELEIKIEEAEDLIPLKEDELKIEEDEADVIFQEVAFYREQLVTLEERATEKKKLFEEAQEEHNSLITALQQAKKIISGLKSSAFLQKEGSNFVQLKSHFSNTLDFITKPHNRAMLNYLIQVSQVSDQSQVQNILDIFDDLINATQQTQQLEAVAEQRRISLYESDKTKLVENIADGETKLANAQADIKTAESRLRQSQESLNSLKASQDSKKIQKQDQQKVCADQVATLESRNSTYAELLELLRQVLILLENSSISQVKMMMSDIEGDDEEVIEGEYLTYSADEGELHSKEDYLAELQPESQAGGEPEDVDAAVEQTEQDILSLEGQV